jgi:hypothetical protein
MFYRWRRQLQRWRFERAIAGVMDTPSLRVTDANWSIVSMIGLQDVPMYLLAIKSLCMYIGTAPVVGIITRRMPETMRTTLRRHIDGIELVIIEDIDTGVCQRGGCWERLLYILDLSARRYVLQMDSDILAVGPDLSEVASAINRNRAFTMAEGNQFRTLREYAIEAQADPDNSYVGTAIEQRFDQFPDCDRLRYIRGSAGFTGFARGGFARARIEGFHETMRNLLPARWTEWGSEQVASNFAVANSPDPVALPYPAYGAFGPGLPSRDAKCFHFIGTYRFMEGYFARRGREVIQRLRDPAHGAAAA